MLSLAILLPALPIVYEDFRYRAIHWIWVVLLSLAILCVSPLPWPLVGINGIFIGLQIVLLSIYFSLKHQKWIDITQDYLGIGDLVFFIPLCLFFPPLHLILFFIASLILSLLGFWGYCFFTQQPIATVPLAGCMALVLIFTQTIAFWQGFDLQQDFWVLQLLS